MSIHPRFGEALYGERIYKNISRENIAGQLQSQGFELGAYDIEAIEKNQRDVTPQEYQALCKSVGYSCDEMTTNCDLREEMGWGLDDLTEDEKLKFLLEEVTKLCLQKRQQQEIQKDAKK